MQFGTYKLSSADHDAIRDDIIEFYTSGLAAVEAPTSVILGGQPGCGKSVLIGSYRNSLFSDGNVAIVNGDEIRRFHPRGDEILTAHEKEYAAITDLDVRDWTSALLDHAIESRYNIIFEGTMRTNAICRTIERLKEVPYQIVVAVMAVGAHVSLFSVCNRYLAEKRATGRGRRVSFRSHDEAYNGLPITLGEIIELGLFDRIDLYRRDMFAQSTSTIVEVPGCPDNSVSILERIRGEKIGKLAKHAFLEKGQALSDDLRECGESDLADSFMQRFSDELDVRT